MIKSIGRLCILKIGLDPGPVSLSNDWDIKVQLFWEGHKNLRNIPHGFDIYVKTMRKIAQIFMAFSEKLNFSKKGWTIWSHILVMGLKQNIISDWIAFNSFEGESGHESS